VFNDVSIDDSGQYTCLAVNSQGSAEVSFLVDFNELGGLAIGSKAYIFFLFKIFFSHPHLVHLDDLLEVKVRPGNKLALEGSDVMFDCSVTSDDLKSTLLWEHNDLMVYPNGRRDIYSNGSLAIRRVQSADTGSYTCMAVNMLGSGLSKVTLEVKPLSCEYIYVHVYKYCITIRINL